MILRKGRMGRIALIVLELSLAFLVVGWQTDCLRK